MVIIGTFAMSATALTLQLNQSSIITQDRLTATSLAWNKWNEISAKSYDKVTAEPRKQSSSNAFDIETSILPEKDNGDGTFGKDVSISVFKKDDANPAFSLTATKIKSSASGSQNDIHGSVKWNLAGNYSWTVPSGVSYVHLFLKGASGLNGIKNHSYSSTGCSSTISSGGFGEEIDTVINVNEGETINISIGKKAPDRDNSQQTSYNYMYGTYTENSSFGNIIAHGGGNGGDSMCKTNGNNGYSYPTKFPFVNDNSDGMAYIIY